ncbi:MAG: HIT domain-containing protein [Steroidobacteraceae bacterium]
MADTIFKKIIDGEILAHRVYEDDKVLAILDIGPLSRGHVLVIPKEPAETLDALSEESAEAIGRVLPGLCRAIVAVTGLRDYNVLQNNGHAAHQAVRHVHFHIIPKPSPHEGLGVGWPAGNLGSDASELAAKIRAALP